MAFAFTCPTTRKIKNSVLSSERKEPLHSCSYKNPKHISPPPFTAISKSPLIIKTRKRSSSTVAPLRSSTTLIDCDLSTPTSTSQSLKARLKNGETLYGLFLLSFSPTLAEIAGLAGYDFVVVDMEHGYQRRALLGRDCDAA